MQPVGLKFMLSLRNIRKLLGGRSLPTFPVQPATHRLTISGSDPLPLCGYPTCGRDRTCGQALRRTASPHVPQPTCGPKRCATRRNTSSLERPDALYTSC